MHFFAFEKKNIMDKKIFIRHPLLSFADSDGIIMLSFADSDGIIMSSFVDSDGIIMLSFADSDSITMLRMSNEYFFVHYIFFPKSEKVHAFIAVFLIASYPKYK